MVERGHPGPAVDVRGAPAVDPSENVKALTAAGLERQDDLREMEARHIREFIAQQGRCDERIQGLLAQHDRELRHAEAARIDQLRDAEAKRIDAIRATDAAQVTRAAEVAALQAQTLAAQVATSAEALRTQVAAAATAGSLSLTSALEPIQKDVADLRKTQYEQAGQKTQVIESRSSAADMAPIVDAIKELQATMNQNLGQKAEVVERRLSNAAIFGMMAAVAVALGLLMTLVTLIVNSGGAP